SRRHPSAPEGSPHVRGDRAPWLCRCREHLWPRTWTCTARECRARAPRRWRLVRGRRVSLTLESCSALLVQHCAPPDSASWCAHGLRTLCYSEVNGLRSGGLRPLSRRDLPAHFLRTRRPRGRFDPAVRPALDVRSDRVARMLAPRLDAQEVPVRNPNLVR